MSSIYMKGDSPQSMLYIIAIYTGRLWILLSRSDVNKNDTLKLILSFSETAAVMLGND